MVEAMVFQSSLESINVVQVPPLHIFLDTETTGLGHVAKYEIREDAVIEIGLAFRLDGDIYSRSWLCNPGEKYFQNGRADEALSVSKIPMDAIMNAPSATEVAVHVKGFLANLHYPLTNRPIPILHSYNIGFDRPFLEKSPWYFEYDWGADPMLLAADIINPESGRWPRLEDAMHFFNIKREGNAHSALSDAIAALKVHEACLAYQESEI